MGFPLESVFAAVQSASLNKEQAVLTLLDPQSSPHLTPTPAAHTHQEGTTSSSSKSLLAHKNQHQQQQHHRLHRAGIVRHPGLLPLKKSGKSKEDKKRSSSSGSASGSGVSTSLSTKHWRATERKSLSNSICCICPLPLLVIPSCALLPEKKTGLHDGCLVLFSMCTRPPLSILCFLLLLFTRCLFYRLNFINMLFVASNTFLQSRSSLPSNPNGIADTYLWMLHGLFIYEPREPQAYWKRKWIYSQGLFHRHHHPLQCPTFDL